MKLFSELCEKLASASSPAQKISHLEIYFAQASVRDVAWGIFFLTGRRFPRLVSSDELKVWALEKMQMPLWLYEESYGVVGDTAETLALLLDSTIARGNFSSLSLVDWVEHRLLPLKAQETSSRKPQVQAWWTELSLDEIALLNKFLTGTLRIAVSQALVEKALAHWTRHPPALLAQRFKKAESPTAEWVSSLHRSATDEENISCPYPFASASLLSAAPVSLGAAVNWFLEWQWDGMRAQIICREGQVFIWSRDEENLTEKFPEIAMAAAQLPPGTVLDGEIVAFVEEHPLSLALLQSRYARKKLNQSILRKVPVVFIAFDCLERAGQDIRAETLLKRREHLEHLFRGVVMHSDAVLRVSEGQRGSSWEVAMRLHDESRGRGVEGLILKRLHAAYGQSDEDWWKWKANPFRVEAVLLYAQVGKDSRAKLFTEYTFAVWHDKDLVPITKASTGLSEAELGELDQWIRAHTRERFGPVRSLVAEHVFTIEFAGLSASSRHRAGVVLRAPRILQWRRDKKITEIYTLADLHQLLAKAGSPALD